MLQVVVYGLFGMLVIGAIGTILGAIVMVLERGVAFRDFIRDIRKK